MMKPVIDTSQRIVSLGFKHEQEDDDGRAIGPVFARFADGSSGRVEGGCYTRRAAEVMASHLGVELEEL